MNKARELTQEEMALVCGGFWGGTSDHPPIEATLPGYGGDPWDWYGPPYSGDPYDPYPDNGGGGGGGGGGGSGDTYASIDAATDQLARDLASIIKSDPRFNSVEIGAILYKDNVTGEIKAGPLAYGTSADPAAITLTPTAWGITPDEVIGIIHSHPASLFSGHGEYEQNKYPSDNFVINGVSYTGKDWGVADLFASEGMDESLFRHYIIGPDNITREYDFYDRDRTTPGNPI